jgi:hypothetical protein
LTFSCVKIKCASSRKVLWLIHRRTPNDFTSTAGGGTISRPLPWLDADLALFIAVNREIGADLGIALDYRTSSDDPRVVASDRRTGDHTCHWKEAFPTFSASVAALRL